MTTNLPYKIKTKKKDFINNIIACVVIALFVLLLLSFAFIK